MAITSEALKAIIADQRTEEIVPVDCFTRANETRLMELGKNKEIIVITGLRRCGKSVLLHKERQRNLASNYYFNFEDERLAEFTSNDFQLLQQVFVELYGVQKTYYFDEIQNIPGWEQFVRRLYNSGNKIFITGSNANLFSEELGTRLTGRYMTLTTYPLSFHEYVNHYQSALLTENNLSTIQTGEIRKRFSEYSQLGGIPEYVKLQDKEYLHLLYSSIIYRDIIVRYKLTGDRVIKTLVFYLASHCGKEVTYGSLKKYLAVGSATTVADYCGYLENSYLCFFVNRYSHSLKSQAASPRKVYFIDHALAQRVGFRISEDAGRMLENMVFIELKRRKKEVFYHRSKKECDFVVRENHQITAVIQVCKTVNDPETKKRELAGLIEAMEAYQLSEGLILTEAEQMTESITHQGRTYHVRIMPVWKWLLVI